MDAFQIRELLEPHQTGRHEYAEFFRSQWLSLAIAVWPAGSNDEQRPHTEDEAYYVVEGSARITVAGEQQLVSPGSVVFVAAGAAHHFDPNPKDLKVLVSLAPPPRARTG